MSKRAGIQGMKEKELVFYTSKKNEAISIAQTRPVFAINLQRWYRLSNTITLKGVMKCLAKERDKSKKYNWSFWTLLIPSSF